MKTIGKLVAILTVSFLLFVYVIHGGLSVADFNAAFVGIRSDHSLNGIPATFRGSLDVKPQGRSTRTLSAGLIKLALKYGMNPAAENASDGSRWQLQIYCHGNFVGGITTARGGELIMFQTSPYGFKEEKDYEAFNGEMVAILGEYGDVRILERQNPLSHKELIARGVYMKMDVSSQCSPKK